MSATNGVQMPSGALESSREKNMSGELTTQQDNAIRADVLEKVLLGGDLSHLTAPERLQYYRATCTSLGLNPLTKPFDYLALKENGEEKLVLYARRDCADQLRKIHDVSVKVIERELVDGVYTVKAQARMPSGREDESIGAVPLVKEVGEWKTSQGGKRYFQTNGTFQPLPPNDRANAIMKAETKAKRRVTLSICGLGMLDESEIETISGAQPYQEHRMSPETAESKEAEVQHRVQEQKQARQTEAAAPVKPDTPDTVQEMYKTLAGGKDGFAKVFGALYDKLVEAVGEPWGAEIYSQTLGQHGVQSWQNFKSMAKAKDCVLALWNKLQEAKQEPPKQSGELFEAEMVG